MYRKAMEELIRWKEDIDRKPLILNGARQVGKTWILKEFGNKYYTKTAYINMDNNQRMKELFGDFDTERLIQGFKAETQVDIEPENTLIIIDEIQEVPDAITSLKYFCENAREYHIVVAGSLLGVSTHKGVSFPVGKVNFLNLYPLNFEEYLLAIGKESLVELLKNNDMDIIKVFSDQYKSFLKEYYYIGGMPEVVDSYVKYKDYNRVRKIQNEILMAYEKDFSKHVPKNELPKVLQIWRNFNTQLARENKKFIYGALKPSARAAEYEDAINWLVDSGLMYKINRVNACKIPLEGYIDYSAFKLYFIDVGLLAAKNDLNIQTILEGNKIFTEYKGSLTEQYVLGELKSNYNIPINYWSNDAGQAEVDFIIQYENKVIPLEVKAEENLQSKSLKVLVEKYKTECNVRTAMTDYKKENWLINIPLYCIENIEKII